MTERARRTAARFHGFKVIWIAAGVALAAGALAAACGGSASESPWPVEPDTPVLGPEGEEGRTPPPGQRLDAGRDTGPNVEP
jgi:hypothetical protein